MSRLRARDAELRDLARGSVPLFDARSGTFTGVTLTRLIGVGGMGTVFQGELDPAQRSSDLSENTPHVLAVKIMKPSTASEIDSAKESVHNYFAREVVALSRVMERVPPTEFVVGCFGSGMAEIDLGEHVRQLPWIAIELVSGGIAGVSLATRVERELEGIDPVRALRLARGIIEGVRILHGEGVIHRDLKPDNVLVAGPVDDETPKLADCGIARVEGFAGTVVGLTYSYGAPEQFLSKPGVSNSLIGVWTDVHALAAVLWFILAGEDWCRGGDDDDWRVGMRRSLRTAAILHPGLLASGDSIERIDAVLQRGAATKLPDGIWNPESKRRYEAAARICLPSMFEGPERYSTVEAFASDLLPLIENVAARWKERATREKRAPTALRPTYLAGAPESESLVTVQHRSLRLPSGVDLSVTPHPLASGTPVMAVYQPDGKALGLFGDRLMSIVHQEASIVPIPPHMTSFLIASKWLVRGPGAGFALVGSSHVLLVGRNAEPCSMLLPRRPSGARAGSIVAAVGDGRVFGIITEEDDGDTDPELWLSEDGSNWAEPAELPLGGRVNAIASGPYGFIIVGMRKPTRGRALFLGYDGSCRVVTKHVTDQPALWGAVCGTGKDCWAAGHGVLLRIDGDSAEPEQTEATGMPVAMGLDLVGTPWLVTKDAVLRRHATAKGALWKVYYRHNPNLPVLAAIGFTPEGAHVLDAAGGSIVLAPHDIDRWRG